MNFKKRNKHGNKKAYYDGIIFDSIKEKDRYMMLSAMLKDGVITKLILQPKFKLQPGFKKNGKKIQAITWKADFSYIDSFGNTHIEDVKGWDIKKRKYLITEPSALRHKMFEYKYPDLTIELI